VALCSLLIGACTPAPPPPPDGQPPEPSIAPQPRYEPGDARAGGTLRVGVAQEPGSIDPRFVVDPDAERIVGQLFDPLVRLDEDGRVVPAAAESWEVLDGGSRLRFHLRAATFHDGEPVTAGAFQRSFDRIADGTASPRSFLSYLLEPIAGSDAAETSGAPLAGLEVEDDRTLVISLEEPMPGYLVTLAHPTLVPLPEVASTDPQRFAEQPVGNGPFAMNEPREPGSFLRLTSFPDHHTPPLLDEVVVQIYVDDPGRQQQWDDLTSGLLQVGELLPEQRSDAAATFGMSSDGYRGPGLLTGESSTTYLYGFDTTTAPYDDPQVRRALSLAIDRDRLADDVMQGTRRAADSLVPPPIPGSQEAACEHCRHDPMEARSLFAAAETDVTSVTLTHVRGASHAAIAQSMAADIEAALGISVDLQARDLEPFVRAVRAGEVPLFWLGWEASEPDPGSYLFPLFHSSQIGQDNVSGYRDSDVDRLLETARSAPTAAIATPFHQGAERRILEDAPVLPLLWHRHAVLVTSDVRDLYWSPLGRVDLSVVWLADRS